MTHNLPPELLAKMKEFVHAAAYRSKPVISSRYLPDAPWMKGMRVSVGHEVNHPTKAVGVVHLFDGLHPDFGEDIDWLPIDIDTQCINNGTSQHPWQDGRPMDHEWFVAFELKSEDPTMQEVEILSIARLFAKRLTFRRRLAMCMPRIFGRSEPFDRLMFAIFAVSNWMTPFQLVSPWIACGSVIVATICTVMFIATTIASWRE